MYKIGFIGCGKIAKSIIKGICEGGFIEPSEIIASKFSPENLDNISKDLQIKIVLDNKYVAENSNIIFLAVKPTQITEIAKEIKSFVTSDKVIISVLAGVTTKTLEEMFGEIPIIRVMPNTPVIVKEGMAGICTGKYVKDEHLNYVQSLFNSIGKSVVVEENQIDIVTAISGSGPAFYYKVINDIARAGEKLGLEYEKSLLLSVQTALGSAKMALNKTISMEELISNVATKGGCTAVGVDVMNDTNTSDIFYNVIKTTKNKATELGNPKQN